MKIINNNPFRIIGVYSNSSIKDISSHISRAIAYAKIQKKAEFQEDMSAVLPSVSRAEDTIRDAQNKINLPIDKLKYALFWFCDVSSIDGVALGHLQIGNIAKALELLGKQSNFSSLVNKGVLLLMQNSTDKEGIASLLKVIHDGRYRNAFVKAICGDIFQIEEDTLAHIFIDELLSEISACVLYGIFRAINISSLDCDYLREKVISVPIAKINNAIGKAQSVPNNNALANYIAGMDLINNTKGPLSQIHSLLSETDVQYQRISDNLAKTILQCGINYFNNSNDGDSIDNALEIQKEALKIAVGKITKERCQKNIDILNEQKEQSKIRADIDYVANALKSFQIESETIDDAISLVKRCKPHLQNIKNVLGTTNDFYLSISSAVANNALGMCVSIVNDAPSVIKNTNVLKDMLVKTLSAMAVIGSLDMNPQERRHFNTNKSILQNILLDLPASTPTSTPARAICMARRGLDLPASTPTSTPPPKPTPKPKSQAQPASQLTPQQTSASTTKSDSYTEENTLCVWLVIGFGLLVIILAMILTQ